MEVDGFEPPRPRRVQDLQSRAIGHYAIPPLVPTQGNDPWSHDYQSCALPLSYAGKGLLYHIKTYYASGLVRHATTCLQPRRVGV